MCMLSEKYNRLSLSILKGSGTPVWNLHLALVLLKNRKNVASTTFYRFLMIVPSSIIACCNMPWLILKLFEKSIIFHIKKEQHRKAVRRVTLRLKMVQAEGEIRCHLTTWAQRTRSLKVYMVCILPCWAASMPAVWHLLWKGDTKFMICAFPSLPVLKVIEMSHLSIFWSLRQQSCSVFCGGWSS